MSFDVVKNYFESVGLLNRVKHFDVSSATVDLAAKAIGCEPCKIAKSLTFMAKESPIMVVTAGDAKIDNSKYKSTFGLKAKMLTAEAVISLVGHAVGGVCPFVVKENVKVYLDVSLKRFERVYPACGSGNSAVELTIEELEKHSNYVEWVDVAKY